MFRVKASRDWFRHEPAVDASLDIAPQFTGIPSTITPAGEPFVATVTATNQAPIPVLNASASLKAPAGWKVEQLSPERKHVLHHRTVGEGQVAGHATGGSRRGRTR